MHGLGDVNVLPVDVVPGAAAQEGDVVRQVEAGGDKGQAEEEEDDGAWGRLAMHARERIALGVMLIEGPTEKELLPGRKHVDAKGNLELVLLEAQPLSERSKNRHDVELMKRKGPSFICACEYLYQGSSSSSSD